MRTTPTPTPPTLPETMRIKSVASRTPIDRHPQVANVGGHPVQPPFKIPESIIY